MAEQSRATVAALRSNGSPPAASATAPRLKPTTATRRTLKRRHPWQRWPQAGKPSIYHRAPTPYEVPESALATLEAEGLCVVDNWAPQAGVQALRRDVDQLWDAGKFIASKVGSRSVSADTIDHRQQDARGGDAPRITAWLRPPRTRPWATWTPGGSSTDVLESLREN